MDALESAFNKRVRQLQRAAQKSTGAKKMKRLMACSIFALYPVIAVCAPGRLLRIQTSGHKFYK